MFNSIASIFSKKKPSKDPIPTNIEAIQVPEPVEEPLYQGYFNDDNLGCEHIPGEFDLPEDLLQEESQKSFENQENDEVLEKESAEIVVVIHQELRENNQENLFAEGEDQGGEEAQEELIENQENPQQDMAIIQENQDSSQNQNPLENPLENQEENHEENQEENHEENQEENDEILEKKSEEIVVVIHQELRENNQENLFAEGEDQGKQENSQVSSQNPIKEENPQNMVKSQISSQKPINENPSQKHEENPQNMVKSQISSQKPINENSSHKLIKEEYLQSPNFQEKLSKLPKHKQTEISIISSRPSQKSLFSRHLPTNQSNIKDQRNSSSKAFSVKNPQDSFRVSQSPLGGDIQANYKQFLDQTMRKSLFYTLDNPIPLSPEQQEIYYKIFYLKQAYIDFQPENLRVSRCFSENFLKILDEKSVNLREILKAQAQILKYLIASHSKLAKSEENMTNALILQKKKLLILSARIMHKTDFETIFAFEMTYFRKKLEDLRDLVKDFESLLAVYAILPTETSNLEVKFVKNIEFLNIESQTLAKFDLYQTNLKKLDMGYQSYCEYYRLDKSSEEFKKKIQALLYVIFEILDFYYNS